MLAQRQRRLFTPEEYLAIEEKSSTKSEYIVPFTGATLVVEIPSPTTELYDRGEKFLLYKGLPSFREYLLVSQDQKKIEHHVKSSQNSWRSDIVEGDTTLKLESIGHELDLEEV